MLSAENLPTVLSVKYKYSVEKKYKKKSVKLQ